jgi:hypothetical protein
MTQRNGLSMRWAALALLLAALAACGRGPEVPREGATFEPAIASAGGVTVRASVLPTSRLSERVARQYGIARSDATVLLLVSARRGSGAGETSVPARVVARVADLQGRSRALTLRELRVGDGADALLDYVGTVEVDAPETLVFDLEVVPQGAPAQRLQFTRDFFP